MLNLAELSQGLPAITAAFGQYLAEAGAVCLEAQGHSQDSILAVHGHGEHIVKYTLRWPPVTEQMRRCLNDPEVATEHGAIGIAILLVKKLIGYSVLQRSRKGTGFDYWLGDNTAIPFQNMARLEISGIRTGNEAAVSGRIQQKLKQTNPSDLTGLPAYIVVIEFSLPLANVRHK